MSLKMLFPACSFLCAWRSWTAGTRERLPSLREVVDGVLSRTLRPLSPLLCIATPVLMSPVLVSLWVTGVAWLSPISEDTAPSRCLSWLQVFYVSWLCTSYTPANSYTSSCFLVHYLAPLPCPHSVFSQSFMSSCVFCHIDSHRPIIPRFIYLPCSISLKLQTYISNHLFNIRTW